MKYLIKYLENNELKEVLKRNKKFLRKVQHCSKKNTTFETCYNYLINNRNKFGDYYIIVYDSKYTDYILYKDVYVTYTRSYEEKDRYKNEEESIPLF